MKLPRKSALKTSFILADYLKKNMRFAQRITAENFKTPAPFNGAGVLINQAENLSWPFGLMAQSI